MTNRGTASKPERDTETGVLAEAKRRLFPPLRNKTLAEAADALAENRPDIAEPLLAKYLEKNTNDPDALNLMADVARRAGRLPDAERLLARCLETSPRSAGIRYNRAVLLRRLEKFEDALAELDALLKDDQRNPLFRDQKALLLNQMGRTTEALAIRRELVEEHPRSAELWLEYAHNLRNQGFGNECIAAFHAALALSPATIAIYLHLADLKTYRFAASEIEAMEALRARPGLSAAERGDLHFALGKAYADERVFSKSFDNYARGNALRRIGTEYDVENIATHRRNCEGLFTSEFFRERTGWGNSSGAPIFIVGMPRSGSTLVEQILSSHSAIEGLGELADLDNVVGQQLCSLSPGRPVHEFWIGGSFEFRRGLLETLPRAVQQMDAENFRALADDYLAVTSRRRMSTRPFFTDKGLRNFGHIGLLAVALPRAKIIDARRHPLDCGWSCFRSDFPSRQPFTNRLVDIGRVYANYQNLMSHFNSVLPGRIHRVSYEDLIGNPQYEVRRLLDYVGLPYEDACLRFHENRRAVKTLSSEQVRTPLYGTGIGQWRPYEEWLGPLKAALDCVLENYRSP